MTETICSAQNLDHPTDENLRKTLKEMIDVLDSDKLHAMYLVCSKLFLVWYDKSNFSQNGNFTQDEVEE